ncbi:MAG: class-III pyridoxal-phosphate-dependent aminotransferase [Candidatus Humimicrobiaceae bacterium]
MDPIIKQILEFKKDDILGIEKYLMIGGGTPGVNLVKGQGIWVEDIEGNKYIDCTSQSYSLSLGFSHPEIVKVVQEQVQYSYHFHTGFFTIPRYLLAEKIAEVFPEKMNRVLFTIGGSMANEAALKIAMINNPGAHNFIALYGAYHGTSFLMTGATHMATYAYEKWLGPADMAHHSYNFMRVPPPYYYRPYFEVSNAGDADEVDRRALDELEKQIKYGSTGPVCAMIMEPLQGSGGQLIFSKKYLQGVKDICKKYGIVLIWDCIQTAFGRMGTWSAAEYYGITPDIMTVSKCIAAGFPLSAVIVSEEIEGMKMNGIDLHTYGNNQLSQVVALKQIEIIKRDKVLDNVTNVGNYLKEELLKIKKEFPQMGDVRAIGFHIGIELIKDLKTKEPDFKGCAEMRKTGFKNGIIFGDGGVNSGKNVLKIKPPLITTRNEADMILEKYYKTLKEVYA